MNSHFTNICNKLSVEKTNLCDSWEDAIMEVAFDNKKRNYREYFTEIKERKLYPINSEDDVKFVKKTLSKIINNNESETLLSQDRRKSPYRYWKETREEKTHQKKIEDQFLKCEKNLMKIKESCLMEKFIKQLGFLRKMKYEYHQNHLGSFFAA